MNLRGITFEPAESMIVNKNKQERISRLWFTSNLENVDNSLRKPSLNQELAYFNTEESVRGQEKLPWGLKVLHLSVFILTAVANTITVPVMNWFFNNEISRSAFFFWKFVFMLPVLILCIPLEQKLFNLEFNDFLNKRSITFMLTASTTYLIWQFLALTSNADIEGGVLRFLENIPVIALLFYYLYKKFTLSYKETIGLILAVLGAFIGSLFTNTASYFSVFLFELLLAIGFVEVYC